MIQPHQQRVIDARDYPAIGPTRYLQPVLIQTGQHHHLVRELFYDAPHLAGRDAGGPAHIDSFTVTFLDFTNGTNPQIGGATGYARQIEVDQEIRMHPADRTPDTIKHVAQVGLTQRRRYMFFLIWH